MIRIAEANAAYEREPLLRPFGFKGGQLTELWQTAVKLSSPTGRSSIGLGNQRLEVRILPGIVWNAVLDSGRGVCLLT